MQLPTYAQALTVPTVTAEEAALLAQFATSTLAGWPQGAPQRDLVHGEALALQWEMVQRAAVAYAASPNRVLQLQGFLVSQGYSPTDAATVASSWVDVVLEIYQSPRIPASTATWSIPLVSKSGSPFTIDNTSNVVLQALDGTIFQAAQPSPLSANSGNAFKVAPSFAARAPGTSGNVIPGTIAKILTAPVDIAIDLTGTQTLTSVARNAESDADALTRAQSRWGTLSGVLTAAGWRFVLMTPDVGGIATLTRVFVDDTNPLGPGSVAMYLVNAAGPATSAEVAAANVIVAAKSIAGMGPAQAFAAVTTNVPLSAVLKTNGSNPLAAAQGASALAQLGPALDGDVLYVDKVIAVLMGIAGVVNVASLSLTADVMRPGNGVIVLQPTVTQT